MRLWACFNHAGGADGRDLLGTIQTVMLQVLKHPTVHKTKAETLGKLWVFYTLGRLLNWSDPP